MEENFVENDYENAVLSIFENKLGYLRLYGPDMERDYHSPFLDSSLQNSLRRINPDLPDAAIQDGLSRLSNLESGSVVQRNMLFTDWLQNGLPVTYYSAGQERSAHMRLVDFSSPGNNEFVAANQWTFIENSKKRPDIVIFVNGLPLVVIELKSPSREETDISEAYRQLRNYLHEIPAFFAYNAFCVMSDMALTKAGTITSDEDHFMEWKTTDGSYENTQYADFDTFFEGMFEKSRFLDIIRNFICFSVDEPERKKILAGYHQYFAVNKALLSTVKATKTDGKGGVFWHTQGSGKSLSMVFYAHALQSALESPTIVVLSDQNNLDNQLFHEFACCEKFLRQVPVQATSRANLRELLANRQANGIIFSTIQKFTESPDPLSDRKNIIVIADEAHRSHYGLVPKVITKTNEAGELQTRTVVGNAKIIRDALPHATFIGFTGTPIAARDRNTREIFGDYIDIYDMTQSVEDGATRPVYYESRVIHLNLDADTLKQIDDEYDIMAENADPYVIEKSKKTLARMEAILGADTTIDSLVNDILAHYENYRSKELTGKAMIVAYSRPIAIKIYHKLLELRPDWEEKIGVVMTQGNNDPEEWRKIIGNKAHKDRLARLFKDNDSPMKIAIVVDMWLTGFNVPSLATMYVYKPMSGHNLMQAIARVNRVFRNKEGGLIVDYVGIASALKQAMSDYTVRDQKNYGDMDIGKTAKKEFLEKLAICRDLLHGFDYLKFFDGNELDRAKTIQGALNFLLAKSHDQEVAKKDKDELAQNIFIKQGLLLKQALSLCSSLVDEHTRLEAAFIEAVRTMLVRLTSAGIGKKFTLPEINARINELLKHSIQSQGVINLFSDEKEGISLFDPAFLEELGRMKEKNLAVEILKKIIAGQVAVYKHTNIVKSEKFSDILRKIMNQYLNGHLTNEQVIQELLKMAHELSAVDRENPELNAEEKAFYDALTRPAAIKDFYQHDELIAITKELTEQLRKSRTIDWQRKESARAGMRRMIKRLLKKHKYPPEGMVDAIKIVMQQCELWADNPNID